jgi:hypothetical protein
LRKVKKLHWGAVLQRAWQSAGSGALSTKWSTRLAWVVAHTCWLTKLSHVEPPPSGGAADAAGTATKCSITQRSITKRNSS